MKLTLMVLGLAMAAGCAHGRAARSEASELRGAARVAETGRMLVAGPAGTVHASVDGPRGVSLFLVDRVHGDDRDCDATPTRSGSRGARTWRWARSRSCAPWPAGGPSFVMWHAHLGERNNLWALQ